jgi:hypothetical protein
MKGNDAYFHYKWSGITKETQAIGIGNISLETPETRSSLEMKLQFPLKIISLSHLG